VFCTIVQGYLNAFGTLNSPIDTKNALTQFRTLSSVPCKRNEALTLVELSPITGRTHQLRIHLAKIGYSIYGDQLHGNPNNTKKNKGLFLFAYRLQFTHPITSEQLDVKLDMPRKFLRYFGGSMIF
jgi:23S rRNA-/tRNA-specific pseudouridylate synthase